MTDPVTGLATQRWAALAKHEGLGVEPAALVEEAAKFATVFAVLLEGVFVVDAGEQALVGEEEEGEARGLVDAAGFGFDDAVFDLVAHAEAVAAADAVGFEQELDEVGELLPVEGDGRPSTKRIVTSSGAILMSSRQKATPMMGATIFMEVVRCSRSLASWVAPRRFESVE